MFNTDLHPSSPESGSVSMRGWMYFGAVLIGLGLMALGDLPQDAEPDTPLAPPSGTSGEGRSLAAPAPITPDAAPALSALSTVPAALHFSAKSTEPAAAAQRRAIALKP